MKVFALLLLLAPALQAAETSNIAWDDSWPRFSTAEYVATGLAAGGVAAEYFLVPAPKTAAWKGPILFDQAARNTLEIGTAKGRNRANVLSDVITYPLIGYSALDGPITAGWVDGNKDTAIQLSLINAETFAVNEFLTLSVNNVLTRKRPRDAECQDDPNCVKSFWSGHDANAFAAASLVCVEHGALPLYGGISDDVACGTALAAASAVGLLRVAADDHYASDVMAGAVIGGATGYLMPKWLHFRSKKSRDKFGYLLPKIEPRGGGLTYVKAW